MHQYTATFTDGVTTVVKTVNANTRVEAARVAADDNAAFAGFDDTATLTITVTQP